MLRVMVSFCLLGIALFAQDEKKVTTLSLAEILNLEVVTASKTAEKISEAPATVYVFTHEMIVNAGYYSLDQLLEAVPEIELQNKAVAEYNNYYSIRGISGNDKFIVLLDGFRFNSPTGSPHVIATNYPLANAKRVEVILGPASALYGADAFGGVVNIITFDESDGAGGQVNASFGDFSTQTLDFNYSMRIQNLFFLLLPPPTIRMNRISARNTPKTLPGTTTNSAILEQSCFRRLCRSKCPFLLIWPINLMPTQLTPISLISTCVATISILATPPIAKATPVRVACAPNTTST